MAYGFVALRACAEKHISSARALDLRGWSDSVSGEVSEYFLGVQGAKTMAKLLGLMYRAAQISPCESADFKAIRASCEVPCTCLNVELWSRQVFFNSRMRRGLTV